MNADANIGMHRIPSAENNVNRTAARRLNRSNAKAKKAAAEQTTSTEATPELTNEVVGKRSRIEAESTASARSAQPAKKARLSSTVHIQETHTSLSETLLPRDNDQENDNAEIDKTATLMDVVQQDENVGSKEVAEALVVAQEIGLETAVEAVAHDDVVDME